MALATVVSVSIRVQTRIRLTHLLKMSERDFEKQIRKIEASEPFHLLREAGVILLRPYSRATFAVRDLGGRELTTSSEGLQSLLDGKGKLARLIQRIGQERFEQLFLRDSPISDQERARLCGISYDDCRELRELVDRLYIKAEFEKISGCTTPMPYYSAVAGIEIQDGKPIIAFFHRDVWKGRYEINHEQWDKLVSTLPLGAASQAKRLLAKLEYMDHRKTALYRALETVIDVQVNYLRTGELSLRVPLTQKRVATLLKISPSAVHHLIANKSIRLPWGPEVPLKTLMPSVKSLFLERVRDLAMDHPEMSDTQLRLELQQVFGARLSRRSVAQYRSDLGIGGRGLRCTLSNVTQLEHRFPND